MVERYCECCGIQLDESEIEYCSNCTFHNEEDSLEYLIEEDIYDIEEDV